MNELSIDSVERLKAQLTSFGDTEERAFEDSLTKMISRSSSSVIDDLFVILNSEVNNELQFRAFFGISIHYRRQNDHTKFKNFVDAYIEKFEQFPLHFHILSLLHKSYGDQAGILKSINYSKKAVEQLNMHAGVLHNHCEAIVTALEEGMDITEDQLYTASLYMERVLALCPKYAKFYCTHGRILAQKNKYNEAKNAVLKAIDLEDSDSKDYSLRISTYRNFLVQFKTLELYNSVSHEIQTAKAAVLKTEKSINELIEKNENTMENLKAQNLQMLAFFTAIISFIIGSINILSHQQDFLEAALLILILAGAMVLVNVGFSVLISTTQQNVMRYSIVTCLGLLLIGVGFFTNTL